MKKETGGIKKVEETSNKEKINNKIEKKKDTSKVQSNDNSINLNQTESPDKLARKGEHYIFTLNNINANNQSNIQQSQNGSDYDMTQAQVTAYNEWNSELNDIYQTIMKNISTSEANELKKNEISWIESKKEAVIQATKISGSDYNQIKYNTLGNMTKKRCYYLVHKYFVG